MSAIANDRIDIRITSEQKRLFKYASELKGFKSLSEFVVFCISGEADKIVRENDSFLNSIEDKRIFVEALLNPPLPNEKLLKAQADYQKFIDDGIVD